MPDTKKIATVPDLDANIQKLTDTIERLHRRGAVRPLRRIMTKLHPADLAAVLGVLPEGYVTPIFKTIVDAQQAGEVFVELAPRIRDIVLEEIPLAQLGKIFEQLPPDELTDLVQHLPPENAEQMKALLEQESKQELEDLLQYSHDTAGGIMTTDFFALGESVSIQEAIRDVRQHYDVEMVFYLYVTDSEGHLKGVVSMRQLLLADPDQPLSTIMNTRIISVHTDTPQQQVASLVDKYQLLGIPVVNSDNILVGMVTIDDVIEVIETQTTRHMLQMAGTYESETQTNSALRIAAIRLPWLFAAFAGGLLATTVIQRFEPILVQVLALSAFLPVVMGMAGNVGVQTATVAVRSLATGALELNRAGAVLLKELRVGMLLGVAYGVLLAAFGWFFFEDIRLAEVVGLTLLVNMTGAALLAMVLPLTFFRLGADPAIATGPFVTTAIDILGVLNYFLIASSIFELA